MLLDILSGILSDLYFDILSHILSGSLFGTLSLSEIHFEIPSGILAH